MHRMKTITFTIKSLEEGFKDFAEAFEAARLRLTYKPRNEVSFTSLEAARNFLTPKRIALLHAIRIREPRSLYELARLVKRNFSSVFKDVAILRRHGLVQLSRVPRSRRRAVAPKVRYEAIRLQIAV